MKIPAVRDSVPPSEAPSHPGGLPVRPRVRDSNETAWRPGPEGEAGRPRTVDLRPRRDLFDRRRWRERARGAARTFALMLGDAAAVAFGLLLAALPFSDRDPWAVAGAIPMAAVLMVLFQAAGGTYGPGPARRRYERAALFGVAAAVAFLWLGHLYALVALSPFRAIVFAALLGGLASDLRILADAAVKRLRRFGWATTPTLIIAKAPRAAEIAAHVGRSGVGHVRVLGWLAPEGGAAEPAGRNGHANGAHGARAARGANGAHAVNGVYGSNGSNGAHAVERGRPGVATIPSGPRALGSLKDLGHVLEAHDVRSVIISAGLETPELKRVLSSCLLRGCSVALFPHALNELPCRVAPRDFLGWPLLELEVPGLHLVQTLTKRALDLALSSVALVLLAPVLAGLAIAVRLDSSGPVLFRQRRLGVGGRPFTIYKFRTMRQDAERLLREDPGLLELYRHNDFKLPPDRDPRITRIGAFLRRTSLDELPQLLNVLAGHMSLVGPRPIVPDEIENYGREAQVFLAVKPGITGHWQVNGRSSIGYPERAHLDIEYIRRWSVMSDLRILFRTVRTVLQREGAF